MAKRGGAWLGENNAQHHGWGNTMPDTMHLPLGRDGERLSGVQGAFECWMGSGMWRMFRPAAVAQLFSASFCHLTRSGQILSTDSFRPVSVNRLIPASSCHLSPQEQTSTWPWSIRTVSALGSLLTHAQVHGCSIKHT
eukprot:266719-Chlamydomonas_euryale.AAC.1